ncbi:hypothetical protein HOP50_01g08760 [Chloropicon primus]|nr:hypothetical protein HOP50_01g08760 [Chloropicon primus]|mmetsp:Transcript_12866/g.36055  ORF Transcript_12866/g.36055 Transcript_12866/m.36055 type:complete len:708 (-) Transcript_12866:2223-4346(-)
MKRPASSDPAERVTKRQDRYPRVARTERCGHCATCTNPKSHRACITMREKWEREVKAEEEQEKAMATAKELMMTLLKKSEEEGYKGLRVGKHMGLLSAEQVDKLVKQVKKHKDSLPNTFLLTLVITKSSEEVKEELMQRVGFLETVAYMVSQAFDDQFHVKAKHLLKLLLKMPFHPEKVPSAELKVLLGSLDKAKKCGEEDLAALGKKIYSQWKSQWKGMQTKKKAKDTDSEVSGSASQTTDPAEKPGSPRAQTTSPRAETTSPPTSPKPEGDTSEVVAAGDGQKQEPAKAEKASEAGGQGPGKEAKAVTTVAMQGRSAMGRQGSPKASGASEPGMPAAGEKSASMPSSKRKKKVTWMPDDYLCQYFEIPNRAQLNSKKEMEKEREKSAAQKRKEEERLEKERIHNLKKQKRDELKQKSKLWQAKIEWSTPKRIRASSLANVPAKPLDSKEKPKLEERNRKVKRMAFRNASYGSSPSEPEMKPLSAAMSNQLKNLLASKDLMRNLQNIQSMTSSQQAPRAVPNQAYQQNPLPQGGHNVHPPMRPPMPMHPSMPMHQPARPGIQMQPPLQLHHQQQNQVIPQFYGQQPPGPLVGGVMGFQGRPPHLPPMPMQGQHHQGANGGGYGFRPNAPMQMPVGQPPKLPPFQAQWMQTQNVQRGPPQQFPPPGQGQQFPPPGQGQQFRPGVVNGGMGNNNRGNFQHMPPHRRHM